MKILSDDGTIKGGWINAGITILYIALIIAGMISADVRKAIIDLQSFLSWFYLSSFGVWTLGRTITSITGAGQSMTSTGQQSEGGTK